MRGAIVSTSITKEVDATLAFRNVEQPIHLVNHVFGGARIVRRQHRLGIATALRNLNVNGLDFVVIQAGSNDIDRRTNMTRVHNVFRAAVIQLQRRMRPGSRVFISTVVSCKLFLLSKN